MKACIAVVWRGEKSLLSDPESELRLGREKGERKSGKTTPGGRDEQNNRTGGEGGGGASCPRD